jgi:hypothetical protein
MVHLPQAAPSAPLSPRVNRNRCLLAWDQISREICSDPACPGGPCPWWAFRVAGESLDLDASPFISSGAFAPSKWPVGVRPRVVAARYSERTAAETKLYYPTVFSTKRRDGDRSRAVWFGMEW